MTQAKEVQKALKLEEPKTIQSYEEETVSTPADKHDEELKVVSTASPNFAPPSAEGWQPTVMFFYGSLMDPRVLSGVIGLKSPPKYNPGKIVGFTSKMWGPYPTMIHDNSISEVLGLAYTVEEETQLKALQRYETNNYTWRKVDIYLEDGSVVVGRVFVWNGSHDELSDGTFDLKKFQAARYGHELS